MKHQAEMPEIPDAKEVEGMDLLARAKSPFVTQLAGILNNDSTNAHEKRTRQWIKCKGRISEEGGTQSHLSALAYMSDSYFIGTVARTHRLWKYDSLTKTNEKAPSEDTGVSPKQKEKEILVTSDILAKLKTMDLATLRKVEDMDDDLINQLNALEIVDGQIVGLKEKRPEIGMMVSLDHSIYFHNPRKFRADEWLLTEAETPWAGDGRGYVNQRIFARDGTLVASCTQEVSPAPDQKEKMSVHPAYLMYRMIANDKCVLSRVWCD